MFYCIKYFSGFKDDNSEWLKPVKQKTENKPKKKQLLPEEDDSEEDVSTDLFLI